MPDITLCMNINCPIKKHCGRFMGKPDPQYQSFANFQPSILPDGCFPINVECDYFWDIRDYPYELKK